MATERSIAGDSATPAEQHDDAEQPSIGDLARDISDSMSTLVRGEIELAKLEFAGLFKRVATSAMLFVVAATIVLFSLIFPFIALAEGLVALGLWRWLSYLIVWVVLLMLAGLVALVGYRVAKRARKPERTMRTVRDTAAWARHPTTNVGSESAAARTR